MLKQLHAADLLPGDLIDFEPVLRDFPPTLADVFADLAAYEANLTVAESEMFQVVEIERETARTYVLHTDHISFPVTSDYPLAVERTR